MLWTLYFIPRLFLLGKETFVYSPVYHPQGSVILCSSVMHRRPGKAAKGADPYRVHCGWPSQILVAIYPSRLWVTHCPLPLPIFGLSVVAELVTVSSEKQKDFLGSWCGLNVRHPAYPAHPAQASLFDHLVPAVRTVWGVVGSSGS